LKKADERNTTEKCKGALCGGGWFLRIKTLRRGLRMGGGNDWRIRITLYEKHAKGRNLGRSDSGETRQLAAKKGPENRQGRRKKIVLRKGSRT